MRMACKKYRKRVKVSYKSSKGMGWMDEQMKRTEGGHQGVWGHNHEIIKAEQKHTLADDCTSFDMRQMTTRTYQLIHISKATGSEIYTRGSEVGSQGLAKALVLSLKLFHAQYYRLYEKGQNQGYGGSPRPTLK